MKTMKIFLAALFVTPILFAQTMVAPKQGGTGINTSGSTGCPQITAGVWTVGTCGGGGGGDNLPAPLGQLAGYPTTGTTTTVGPGNAGSGGSIINLETFQSNGIITSDQFATNPTAPTNGISNSQATCQYVNCVIEIPASSTDPEQGTMLPVTTTNASSSLHDQRANSDAHFTTNAQPSSFTGYQFQTPDVHAGGFTLPNPGFLQGGEQVSHYEFNVFGNSGWSGVTGTPGGQDPLTAVVRHSNIATITTTTNLRAQIGQPIVIAGVSDTSFNTSSGGATIVAIQGNSIAYSNSGADTTSSGGTATTHTAAGIWALGQWQDITNYFPMAGIKGSTIQSFFTGGGDSIRTYYYTYCPGGFFAGSDEGCYNEGDHMRTPSPWAGTITSISDPHHFIGANTQGNALQGVMRYAIDLNNPLVTLQNMAAIYEYGDSASPSPYVPTIVFNFPSFAISSISSTGGTATATTGPFPGGLGQPEPGNYITIAGVSNSVFNGIFKVTSSTSTTVSYALTGTASSSGGTIKAYIPPSYARGHLVNSCIVPVQEGGVASTQCTVHSDNGTPFTVSGGSAPDGHGLFCAAATSLNEMAYGAEITAITAPDGSGNQVITANINRSVPDNGSTTLAAQGGACGMVVNLNADTINFNGLQMGSAYPVVVSPDDHSVGVAVYIASGPWAVGPFVGSQARTEANFSGPTVGVGGGTYPATNVKRVGGNLTLSIPFQSTLPAGDAILGQNHISILGCPDATVNGTQTSAFTMPTEGVYTLVQSGSDTTCADGTTSVRLPFNYLQFSMYWGMEVYDVTDHTPGVQPISTLNNGHFAGSYQPNFGVGDTVLENPHPSMKVVNHRSSLELSQPSVEAQEDHEINLQNYAAANGVGLAINNQMIDQFHAVGYGGVQYPATGVVLGGRDPFTSGFAMALQPIHDGCAICVGASTSPYSGLQSWYMYSVNGSIGLKWYQPSQTWATVYGSNVVETINPDQATFNVPLNTRDLEFTTSSFLGGYSNITTNQFGDIGKNAGDQPTGLIGWDNYLGFNAAPVVTTSGTPGSTQYLYQMEVFYDGGSTWSNAAVLATGNATLSGSNFNQISCSILPSGHTGVIWYISGDHRYNIGNCPNSATTINDMGSLPSPVIGLKPYGMAGTLYTGVMVANGSGRGFAFTPNSSLVTSGVPTVTSAFSQPSDGNISADTTTRGDGLATLTAGLFIGPSKLPSTTVAALPPAAANAGVILLVTDASTFTVGSCTGGGSNTMIAVSDGTAWSCH